MSRNVRSGTWTLAEFCAVEFQRKDGSELTINDYKYTFGGFSQVPKEYYVGFFFPNKNGFPDCMQNDDTLYNICYITLLKYGNLAISQIFETADGDLHYQKPLTGIPKYGLSRDMFQNMIYNAVLENAYKINTLYNTTKLVYDPISNYDRTETTTVEHNGTETDETIASNVLTKTGSESHTKGGEDSFAYSGETVTTPSGSTTTVHETTAFNEPTTYSGDSKDTTTYTGTKTTESFNNRKDTTTYNTDEQTVYNNVKDANDIDSTTTHSFNGRNEKTTSNINGNIGVTTSQQMIQSEREVADFLWMDAVAKIITDAICIHTYYDPLEYYITKEEGEIYEY